jgi:hypothetical protein
MAVVGSSLPSPRENWVEKLTPERRAELDEVRNAETAQAIAQSLYKRA